MPGYELHRTWSVLFQNVESKSFSPLCLLNLHTMLKRDTPFVLFPSQDTADCELIHPDLLEVGGGGRSWRWCRSSGFFVAVEEEEVQDSESCGGRFSALSGQQLQHLLPLSGNHTGCYCSQPTWKKVGGGWHRSREEGRGRKAWNTRLEKLKINTETYVNVVK